MVFQNTHWGDDIANAKHVLLPYFLISLKFDIRYKILPLSLHHMTDVYLTKQFPNKKVKSKQHANTFMKVCSIYILYDGLAIWFLSTYQKVKFKLVFLG